MNILCKHCQIPKDRHYEGIGGLICPTPDPNIIKYFQPAEPAATEGTQEEWYCFSCNKTVPESHITYPFDPGGKMGGCKIAVPPAEPVTTGTQEGQAMNLPQTGGVYIGLHEHQNVAPAEPSTPRCKCGHMFLAHLTTGPCDFIGLLMPSHEWGKCPCTAFNPATPQTELPEALQPPTAPDYASKEINRLRGELQSAWNRRKAVEVELSAALTQLAVLRTSRDALLVELTTIHNQVVNGRLCYFGHHTGYTPQISSETVGRWSTAIAAAQQLQEDGNV